MTRQDTVRRLLRAPQQWLMVALVISGAALAAPLSPATRARLAAGKPTSVIVEFNGTAADTAAAAERVRRRLRHDDAGILALRAAGYAAIDSAVTTRVAGRDATRVRAYQHFPAALWRLSSLDAVARLEAHPSVRALYENTAMHAVSVSDLPFINQPQTAAEGATGAGTTIAVIDGGLASNIISLPNSYPDFGTCSAVGTPASTCRVVYNHDVGTSAETVHGTNVAAIALGVAPGAKLAMFDVFNGTSASSSDIIAAIDTAIQLQATYNIVAINMSLGDGTSNASQCGPTLSPFATPITNAKNAGILTVVATVAPRRASRTRPVPRKWFQWAPSTIRPTAP